MPAQPESVAVIGGGVVGCSIAYRLATEGVAVTLVEKDRPGAGATGTSAGNVLAWPDDSGELKAALGAESYRLHRRFLPEIKETSGIDPLDQEVQYLFLALTAAEADDLRARSDLVTAAGLKADWIDAADARALEPRLSPETLGGLLYQDCMQMDAQRFVSALADSARARGAHIVEDEALGLWRKGARVTGVRLRKEIDISCDAVILALGAWTGVLASEWLGTSLGVQPHPLQKLHLRVEGAPLACAVHWGDINMILRRDGLVHAGSKHDPTGFEARPTQDGRTWLLERVATALPGLQFEVAEARAACASMTADSVPVLGPVDGLEGVYVAVAADDGFTLSAVLADMLTELLLRGVEHHLLPNLLPRSALSGNTAED